MTTIRDEFDRLSKIFDCIGHPLKLAPPASDRQLATIFDTTALNIDESLRQLWRISNGSRRFAWFAVGEDLDFTPYDFMSIKDVIAHWQLFYPYDENLYAEWYDDESSGERDPRIQKHFLRHRKWLGFADGPNSVLQFDTDPTAQGTHGQITSFVHDPDGVFWENKSFLSFFQTSNDLLTSLTDDPELLADSLGLQPRTQFNQLGLLNPERCHFVEFNFDGIRVTWPTSGMGAANDSQVRFDPSNALANRYSIFDMGFSLHINRGQLTFVDDGLEFEYGTVMPGDHIRVEGYNKVSINGELRKLQNE